MVLPPATWRCCLPTSASPQAGLRVGARGGPLPKGAESEPEASAESEPVARGERSLWGWGPPGESATPRERGVPYGPPGLGL